MADTSQLSLSGALVEATAAQTRMATGKMHLFKSGFFPTSANVLADFTAQECDFDGYAAVTFTSWNAPVLAGTGYMIYAPTQTFAYVDGSTHIGNSVGGYWLEDTTGDLVGFTTFDPAEPCTANGQAVIRTPTLLYPAGL